MSNRRTSVRGAALLEMSVAMLLLGLAVFGIAQLVIRHHQLVSTIDDWCVGEPTYYVVPSDDPLERTLGMPAALEEELEYRLPPVKRRTKYEIEIESREKSLRPPRATAVVVVEEID